MSEAQPYDDQDVLDTLGDLDVEVEDESDDYDVKRDLEVTRDRSLWYPGADRSLEMPTRGFYPERFPVGAVVHFTAGRSARGDADALATIRGGISNGFSYYCISSTGKIWQTAPLHRWGSHAGKSSYPGLGASLSRQLVGIEICNAGELGKTSAGFEPWWNKSYPNGDARRTIYTKDDVRFVERGGNIRHEGYYHAYTPEQEASLINLLLWLKAQKPQLFEWKYVLGHDEIAPGRKNDPGGALSRTMPEFRAYLAQLEREGHTTAPPLQPPPVPIPKPVPQPDPGVQPQPGPAVEVAEQPAPAEAPTDVAAATSGASTPVPVTSVPVTSMPVSPGSVASAPEPETPAPTKPVSTEPVTTVAEPVGGATPVAAVVPEPVSEPVPRPGQVTGASEAASVAAAESAAAADTVTPSSQTPVMTAAVASAEPAAMAAIPAVLTAAPAVVVAAAVATATTGAPAAEPASKPAEPVAVNGAGERSSDVSGKPDGLELKIGPEFLALLKTYRALEIEFPHLKDVTFAQWALESGYGMSELAVRYKNYAGMKWRPDMAIYAREVYYRPAHDPKDSAYCGFDTLEAFIKGYWHRLDIKSLPYATVKGGWRKHAETPEAFMNFIGPIWAPTGIGESLLNHGYIRKIKTIVERLDKAGLLPSRGVATSRGEITRGGKEQRAIKATAPSARAMQVVANRYAEAHVGGARLTEEQVAQAQLVRQISESAARGDNDGINSALTQLNLLLQKQESKLASEDVRKLVSTLVGAHVVRRNEQADSNVYDLVAKIDAASKVSPPRLIEITQAAAQVYGELGGVPRMLAPHSVETLVAALKRAGAFEWLAKITDRLISGGNQQNIVRRLHAEALIALGHTNAAVSMLELMLSDAMLPKPERSEIEWQLGRAYGQIYVDHVRTTSDAYASNGAFASNVQNAIRYEAAARDDASPGQKIRVASELLAYLKRAQADGVVVPGIEPAEEIARGIIGQLEPVLQPDSDPLDIAAVGEAYLALGEYDAAEAWYRGFAISSKLEPYALSAAVRRLEDIWRLADSEDTMRRPLLALKAAETHQRLARFTLSMEERTQIRSPDFQMTYPDGDLLQYGVLRRIVQAGDCLAWVKDRNQLAIGSAFLVRGQDLAQPLGDELYLLTNTHVICDPELARGHKPSAALTPEEAVVQFEASPEEGRAKIYTLEPRAVWQSPASECNACLLRLKEIPEHARAARVASIEHDITAGEIEDATDGTPVAVLGTTKGDQIRLGLRGRLVHHQGTVVDIGPRMRTERQPVYLHYDAPTVPGNAGSPVYDTTNWQVIGLHHAGYNELEGRPRLFGRAGFHNANEGIYIHSIGRAIAASLKGNRSFHWFKRKSR